MQNYKFSRSLYASDKTGCANLLTDMYMIRQELLRIGAITDTAVNATTAAAVNATTAAGAAPTAAGAMNVTTAAGAPTAPVSTTNTESASATKKTANMNMALTAAVIETGTAALFGNENTQQQDTDKVAQLRLTLGISTDVATDEDLSEIIGMGDNLIDRIFKNPEILNDLLDNIQLRRQK